MTDVDPIGQLAMDVLHRPIGWELSLKSLEELARGNFTEYESLRREAVLRQWWPTLSDEEREQVREEFIKKCDEDPKFREQVFTLLRRQDEGER